MNPHLQRAFLLFEQSRHELAEGELRQALASEPDEAYAHALLALCLSERKQFKEATDEARQAIHLRPDLAFVHYALAHVFHDRERIDEALAACEEATRLEPDDPDYLALQAQLRLNRKEWRLALETAERGLQFTPDHVGCANLRAMALVKLGRKAEAGATIDAALARQPDNAITHANQGWTLLESGHPQKALEHFREALRLEPGNEWARQGIIEALKARNFIYAIMLRYFLWMSRMSAQLQFGILIGGFMGNQMLAGLVKTHPEWSVWITPLRVLYVVFAFLTWTADPLFNLLLRLNRFGRLALSPEQIKVSNWIGGCLGMALLTLGLWVVVRTESILLLVLVFAALVIPLAGTFNCQPGWPRLVMASYTGLMALAGFVGIALLVAAPGYHGEANSAKDDPVGSLATTLLGAFIIGMIASGWVANILIMQRPKR